MLMNAVHRTIQGAAAAFAQFVDTKNDRAAAFYGDMDSARSRVSAGLCFCPLRRHDGRCFGRARDRSRHKWPVPALACEQVLLFLSAISRSSGRSSDHRFVTTHVQTQEHRDESRCGSLRGRATCATGKNAVRAEREELVLLGIEPWFELGILEIANGEIHIC